MHGHMILKKKEILNGIMFLDQNCFTPSIDAMMNSPLASLHEKQRTQIQDMLPQQYYKEKVHIFNT